MSNDETELNQLLHRFSKYLEGPCDRDKLRDLGNEIFWVKDIEEVKNQQSYSLLQKKEQELSKTDPKTEIKMKANLNKDRHWKSDQSQMPSPETLAEEILFIQDKNSLLLARRKSLEAQRNKMLNKYGNLMEKSVQKKVQLKLEMQKLKDELNEALAKSRSNTTNDKKEDDIHQPAFEELQELNSQVLRRIGSFKMNSVIDSTFFKREVLERYKPHMEKILGQIYAYSEHLSMDTVINKFNDITGQLDHDEKKLNSAAKSQHESNIRLQSTAEQLEKEVGKLVENVKNSKNDNEKLQRYIASLKEYAGKEIINMKDKFQRLLEEQGGEQMGPPLSSRAIVVSGEPKKTLRRSISKRKLISREKASPNVPPVEYFVELMEEQLRSKSNL